MEMVGAEEVEGVGEDLTPPLSPLSYSLHDSFLVSHCASCFDPLPLNPLHLHSPIHPLRYCSSFCSSSHSPLHLSSASHLLHFIGESSDLRLALLLLHKIKPLKPYHRISGLLTNRHNLLMSTVDDVDDFPTRIKNGARAMAAAIRIRDGCLDSDLSEECLQAVLCLVITNAVEVQDRLGRAVGIAVYDVSFSWINHSCSPNSCYRFLPPGTHGGWQRCLITPVMSKGCEPIGFSTNSEFLTGTGEICCGPRIVVRSIKRIKKGERITIAYTDLLQPKELRQSDLWSKYRFTCCCSRCVTVPLSFVDQCLQEICVSNGMLCHDVGIKIFTELIDDAICDYLSSNDAESCCKKLENALMNGFHYEQIIIRLHPQHHLSLNAYTTLASAYKVRAMDENGSYALKMKRFSAAYSFLLTLLTHYLFLSESCLIASVANFWIGAGESLLNLATSLVSDYSSEIPSWKCSKCDLIGIYEANFDNVLISEEFLKLKCMTDIIPKVWSFLVGGNSYLEVFKDPFETLNSVDNNGLDLDGQERVDIFRLGVHCLVYGGILSSISGGQDSYLTCYVGRLLNDYGGT